MKQTKNNTVYLICSAKDDLPVAHFGTFAEARIYLNVSEKTLARMLRDQRQVRGLYVEKIIL